MCICVHTHLYMMCAHALVSLGMAAAPSTAVDATAQEKERPAALLGKAKVHCRFCVAGLCTCASLNLRCMCVCAHACWSACLWVCVCGGGDTREATPPILTLLCAQMKKLMTFVDDGNVPSEEMERIGYRDKQVPTDPINQSRRERERKGGGGMGGRWRARDVLSPPTRLHMTHDCMHYIGLMITCDA